MTTWLAVLWLQATPDIRSVSWWLTRNPALRGLEWVVVLALNLLVLVWVLYKLLFGGKNWSIPSALRGRGAGIQEQLRQAEAAHQTAQARLAEIEARIANLPAEMAALEKEAEAEAASEYQRLAEESQRDAERILRLGRQEIAAAAKLAQKELKGLAAALAVDLAARRIQERLTPEQDEAVVRSAVAGMNPGRPN